MTKAMNVLVIDDTDANLETASNQLIDERLTLADSYDQAQDLLSKPHNFDVVLVDLLMPASAQAQGEKGRQFVGKEMPVGIFLALLAAKNGAKYVAVLTDADHHSHPASACFDAFNEGECKPTPFMVEGARVLLSNTRNWIGHYRPENLAEEMDFDEYYRDKNPSVRAKKWRALFDYLTSE